MMQQMFLGQGPSGVNVEDVFSVDLYTGNNAAQSINNGIDLSGEGGLVWTKARNFSFKHILFDTNRGVGKAMYADSTTGEQSAANSTQALTSFNSNGYSLGTNYFGANSNSRNYCSWTFRKAEKFFDIVTYSGNSATRNIPHNLGSQPGMVIIKIRTNNSYGWYVWHKEQYASSTPGPNRTFLLDTNTSAQVYGVITGATANHVSVINNFVVNASGQDYVMYVFAADTPDLIKTGIYTGNGSSQTVNVGFQPQWVLIKNANSTNNWVLTDSTRGTNKQFFVDTANAEQQSGDYVSGFTSNGFSLNSNGAVNDIGYQYAYMAIAAP